MIQTGLGLFRDFVAAAIGVLLIAGLLTEELAGGILLLFVTGAAFGTWAFQAYLNRGKTNGS